MASQGAHMGSTGGTHSGRNRRSTWWDHTGGAHSGNTQGKHTVGTYRESTQWEHTGGTQRQVYAQCGPEDLTSEVRTAEAGNYVRIKRLEGKGRRNYFSISIMRGLNKINLQDCLSVFSQRTGVSQVCIPTSDT